MKTFRIVVGVLMLLHALRLLMRGDWLGCIAFSAIGWSLLLDPKDRSTTKLRAGLAIVVLVCVALQLIFR